MATRFYLPASGTAPATPAYDTNWERQFTGWTRRPLVRSKSNTALATLSEAFGATATQQKLYAQWISETLNVDQTISGTVSMVVGKCGETSSNGDAHLAFSLRVLKADGTFRGTLLLYHATSSEFPLIGSAATRIHSARAITSLACLAGDRLVLEIGIHGVTPANEVMQMRFGDPSATADFALTAGLTTDLDPWMELSATLTFGTPSTPQELAGSVAATSAAAGALRVSKAAAGAVAATSTVAGDLQVIHPQLLGGQTIAVSVSVGAVSVSKLLGGYIAGQSVLAGEIFKPAFIAGIIAARAQAAGAAAVEKPLAGAIPAASILAGDLLCAKLLAGEVPALSGVTGSAQQAIELAGFIAAESIVTGDLTAGVSAELAGIVVAASGLSGALLAKHLLVGAIPGESALAGTLTVNRFLAGASMGISVMAGKLFFPIPPGPSRTFVRNRRSMVRLSTRAVKRNKLRMVR